MSTKNARKLPLYPANYPRIASCTLEYLMAATANRRTRMPWRDSAYKARPVATAKGALSRMLEDQARKVRQMANAINAMPKPGTWTPPDRDYGWNPTKGDEVADGLRNAGMSHLF